MQKDSFRLFAFGTLIALIGLLALARHAALAGHPGQFSAESGQLATTVPEAFLPLVVTSLDLGQPLPLPVAVSGNPPLEFPAIRAKLQAEGRDLSFVKIGFHVGPTGNLNNIGCWERGFTWPDCQYTPGLDPEGIPLFLKSSDSAGPLFEVQELAKQSGVPHTLVFRFSVGPSGGPAGAVYDVPDYSLSPQEAAQKHWALHSSQFPPELDRKYVWFETLNEIAKGFDFETESLLDASPLSNSPYRFKYPKDDGSGYWTLNNTEWLAAFAIETVRLAKGDPADPDDDYRWAAFGWSSGEPEPWHWELPRMREFLQLAADNPDTVAVALHEYSYNVKNIGQGYPYLIGRFQFLFQACDKYDIPRPTVLITEWGWEYQNVPTVDDAMADVRWAAWLYAAFPQVKGAAIWNLGGSDTFGDIHNQTNKLILPLRDYSRSNYFEIYPQTGQIDPSLFPPPPPRDGWADRPVPDRIRRLLDDTAALGPIVDRDDMAVYSLLR